MKRILLVIMTLTPLYSRAISFEQAVGEIRKHSYLSAVSSESKALNEEGQKQSSWSDPMLMVAARNFPKDSLKKDETPMTSIEFGVSQKIPLTTKYSNIADSFNEMSRSKEYELENKYQEFLKYFWDILIDDKKNQEQLAIFRENLVWLDSILKASEKLYTNGTISQQAILDIQIRKSEVEAMISNKEFEATELSAKLSYLLGKANQKVTAESIPWKMLDANEKSLKDFKEMSMKSMLESKDLMVGAKKLGFIPDLTVSLSYMKRANIDKKGDFVSASISFPIPTSKMQYSGYSGAIEEKMVAAEKLNNYQAFKNSELSRIHSEIKKVQNELILLNGKTIKFAVNSRNITSRSYANGGATYFELLQAELKLQELLIKKSELVARENKLKVNVKYIAGENLNETKI